MKILIVGTGKLAGELLHSLKVDASHQVVSWGNRGEARDRSIVVHAGSGRELDDVVAYCADTRSVLVELATGSKIEGLAPQFPVVVCPNTNILMLKFMAMLAGSGHLFKNYKARLTESHQAQKSSTPGTALSMAQALGIPSAEVVSVRDPVMQEEVLNIPPQHLARHAYHQIVIEDGVCSITLETRVYGAAPYADGVGKIISAIDAHALENRRYDVIEFVENGWL